MHIGGALCANLGFLSSCMCTHILFNIYVVHSGMENQHHIIPMDQYQNVIATLYILNQKCMIIIIKASVGMYSGCDTLSLQILFLYFLVLPSLLHPLIGVG